jgi:hypothetical protein
MGAPKYSDRRVNLIKRLAGTMPVAEMAQTIGMSPDALRVWARRHGVDLKMRPREPAPQQATQPGV